jgi:hypothetical protein
VRTRRHQKSVWIVLSISTESNIPFRFDEHAEWPKQICDY